MEIEVQDPGEVYRGSRFDWTGQITQVVLNGKHHFCSGESKNPNDFLSKGRGFYNEFGIDLPIGYAECRPGEQFHKPGIGLLTKKDNCPYSFAEKYEIIPVNITKEIFLGKIEYTIHAPQLNGYGYQLKKTLVLDRSSFSLVYMMKNTGEKAILTNEYVHNFVGFNNRNIDPFYQLHFSFNIDPANFIETVNPMNNVTFDKNEVSWNAPIGAPFFFSRLNHEKFSSCSWELIHTLEKTGVREICPYQVNMVNLWGNIHVVSPELFHPINLMPGEKDQWERKFEFFEL